MRKAVLVVALFVLASASQAQNKFIRFPNHMKGAVINLPEYAPVDRMSSPISEPVAPWARKAAAERPSGISNNSFEIGKMANTFGTLGLNRNQIACDPSTNAVAVIIRSNQREATSVGNELKIRVSSDHGANWGALSPNVANSASPRYPNIFLYNPDKSTNAADVKQAILWPQVVTYPGTSTWGEVRNMQMNLDLSGKVSSTFPTPPNWSIPEAIMVSNATKTLYTICDAVEPSNGQGTGMYYILSSTDGGASWAPVNANLDPFWSTSMIPEDQRVYNLCADVSPDGTRMIFAYIAAKVIDESLPYISSEHMIAYFESTDAGQTWPTEPTFISLLDIPEIPEPLNVNSGLGIAPQLSIGDLDVVYDKYNEPHFLVTVSKDNNPYNPLASAEGEQFSITHVDSTFLCEVGRKGADLYLYPIAPMRIIRGFRYSFMNEGSTGLYPETIYHEPHWAINLDANKIYAKWVEVDSTLKFPYAAVNSQNQLVLFADTIHNAWVAGRHVDTRHWTGGWSEPLKVTNNTEIDVKYSKLAHFAGNEGELHIIYTEWGLGERPDDDPNLTDNTVWYVQGVKVDAVLGIETVSEAPGDFSLTQNYPNPFNPSTTISFTLPQAGRTTLRVYDALGREAATVFDRELTAGTHKVNYDGSSLPSGVYMYRLESGSSVATRSMTLVK